MIEEMCGNCKYWKNFGTCRRFPPVFIFEPDNWDTENTDYREPYAWQQPIVDEDEWCGEWKAKA